MPRMFHPSVLKVEKWIDPVSEDPVAAPKLETRIVAVEVVTLISCCVFISGFLSSLYWGHDKISLMAFVTICIPLLSHFNSNGNRKPYATTLFHQVVGNETFISKEIFNVTIFLWNPF